MLAAFIMLAVIGVVGSALMLSFSQFMAYEIQHSKESQDSQLMDRWQQAIIQSLRPLGPDQRLLPPLGENDGLDLTGDATDDTFIHRPPSFISLPKRTPNGFDVIYCPVSDDPINLGEYNEQTVESNTGTSDSTDYMVGTVADSMGRDYVVQSDPILDDSVSPQQPLAFLMLAINNEQDIPRCHDITYNDSVGVFKAPGAMVRSITLNDRSEGTAHRVRLRSSEFPAGATIDDMLAGWESVRPETFVLYIDDIRDWDNPIVFEADAISTGSKIIIKNEGGTINKALGVTISAEGVDLVLSQLIGLDTDTLGVTITNANLHLKESGVGPITGESANLTVEGDTSTGPLALSQSSLGIGDSPGDRLTVRSDNEASISLQSSSLVAPSASELTIETGDANAIQVHDNSRSVIQSDLTFNVNGTGATGQSAVWVDASSSLRLGNRSNPSVITVNRDVTGAVFQIEGTMVGNEVTFSTPAAVSQSIWLDEQAALTLNATTLGSSTNPPATGISSQGGRHLSGGTTQVYATTCWEGLLFQSVDSQTTGSSEPTDPQYDIVNQSQWQCN